MMRNTTLAAALIACGFALPASAHEFCVSTTDQLRGALAAVSDGGAYQDERNGISVVEGTYSTSDGLGRFLYHNSSATGFLQMWGDFAPGCTSLGEKATTTILDGSNTTQVLVARSTTGYLDILNFTIQNGNTDQPGGGLAVNDVASTTGDVVLRNLIIRNNHTTESNGGFRAFAYGAHVLYFDNILVVGNSADVANGAGQLFGQGKVYMRYDTVSDNTAPSMQVGGVSCGGVPDCEIANSIFWMNSGTDLYVASDASMYFDDVRILGGNAPSTNDNPVTADPLFVDPSAGDYHLGNGSTLLAVSTYFDSGSDNDVEGHNLPLTGTTDVGAYVDTIFNDSLESSP